MTGRPLLGIVFAIVSFGAATAVTGGVSAQPGPGYGGIAVRDQLIAAQENLLNTYRCLFNVDVDVVPGRCPNPVTVSPGVAPANPTQHDLLGRDQLIADQEALLNAYRCRFSIDTHIVPGGCPGSRTPANGAGSAGVAEVRVFRGADASGCEIRGIGDDANCSWLDIDVDFTDGVLPASVSLECRGIVYEADAPGGFVPRGFERILVSGEAILSSSRDALSFGAETELDRFCRYGNSGESVYVVVDGVRSNSLLWDWADQTGTAQAEVERVEIYAGENAEYCLYEDEPYAHCHWIDIDVVFTLDGDELPEWVYVECFAVSEDETVYSLASEWVELFSSEDDLASGTSTELDGVCSHGWDGDYVYVVVDGVSSAEIVWVPHG